MRWNRLHKNGILSSMYGIKAQELLKLLQEKGIVGAEGSIKLELLETNVNISDKSAAGNLLQEWLGHWMSLNGVYNRENVNSQMFPDFYLSDEEERDLLEVKTFDYVKSPNFDVAQFDAYVRSLRTKAFRLDADYLIMGYSLDAGVIKVNDVWLKKIWEITCPSEQFALRTQVKQQKIHNIRPYNFKSMSNGYQPFNSRREFALAIKETLSKYTGDSQEAEQWFNEVETNYQEFARTQL